MKINEQIISRILYYGVLLAAAMIVCGGIWFLTQHWHDPVHLVIQQHPQKITKFFSAQALILCGLWLLLATQYLRVFVTSYLFFANKEIIIGLISLLIFILLIAAFWT